MWSVDIGMVWTPDRIAIVTALVGAVAVATAVVVVVTVCCYFSQRRKMAEINLAKNKESAGLINGTAQSNDTLSLFMDAGCSGSGSG